MAPSPYATPSISPSVQAGPPLSPVPAAFVASKNAQKGSGAIPLGTSVPRLRIVTLEHGTKSCDAASVKQSDVHVVIKGKILYSNDNKRRPKHAFL